MDDEGILAKLVALNIKRVDEERSGIVHWLRQELQAPKTISERRATLDLGDVEIAVQKTKLIVWPKLLPDQVTAVAKVLQASAEPLSPRDVAKAFDGKRASTVEPVLGALTAVGQARRLSDGRYASYLIPDLRLLRTRPLISTLAVALQEAGSGMKDREKLFKREASVKTGVDYRNFV